MIRIKRQYTRPSTDVKWQRDVIEVAEFKIKLQTYIDSKKLISHHTNYSEDGLQMFYSGVWASRADFDEYDVDPDLTLYWDLRNTYYESVGITVGAKVFETV